MTTHHAVVDEAGEVIAVEPVRGDMVEMTVRLPRIAADVTPGQFAELRIPGSSIPLLRRPFSVAWTNRDTCAFVFAPVGAGTRALAALRAGAGVRALGPLGRGFAISSSPGQALLVSGGLGCAPFPLLARALRDAGWGVTVLSGASTVDRLYPAERFRRGDDAIRVVEVTDDGSHGEAGLVTSKLGALLTPGTALFACGPNPMLAAIHAEIEAVGVTPASALGSFEAPMGCGFGTCLGCALPARSAEGTRWVLCCTDGPVFSLDAMDWPALLALPGADVA